MKYWTYLIFSFFLILITHEIEAQGKPLIDDVEMAMAIQEEMEKWGDKVSISDAFQIMGILGFSQETHGGENLSPETSELFHSKISYNKNTPMSGIGIANNYLGKAFGAAQEFNVGVDISAGMALSKKIPVYKIVDLGKEGLIETKTIVSTYDLYPSKLNSFFTALNWGAYCYHVGNTLYDLSNKGAQRSAMGAYLKVATGAASLAAGAVGGPVGVFIGAAIWVFEVSVDMLQSESNKDEEALAYGDFKIFYLKYNENKGINWVNHMQTGGKWSEILNTLREYWKADFSKDKNGVDKEIHRNLVKELYDNYEDRFAYRFINEFIVPDIVGFLQREAERAKKEALASLKDYIASLYDQKTTIRMQLAYQDFSGRKMDVYPPIKLYITNLHEKELMDELYYDVKKNGPNIEIHINKLEYLSWVTKNDGYIFFKIETEKEGKVTQHLMSPNWIKPSLGEDGDGFPVRTEFSERGMNIIVDVPIEVNIPSYQVIVQLVGISGDKLKGISIQGPDGQRVETNGRGEALINVPSIGKSWVYEVDHYGGLNGGKAQLPNKINSATTPIKVNLKSLLYKKSPPMPTFRRLDIKEIQDKIEATILELERGDTDINSANTILNKSISSIEIKLTDYNSSYENSKNLYLKKAAADEIPQEQVSRFLKAKRVFYDLDHKKVWAYEDEVENKFKKAKEAWDKDLEQIISEIQILTDQLNEITAIIQKDAKTFDLNSSRSTYYLIPHSFRKLSIVELEMQTVDKLRTEMEKILDRAKINEPLIDINSSKLDNKLVELTTIRETVNFSKDDYRYRPAINATINATYALDVIKMFMDYKGIDDVVRQLDKGRSNLSWVQLRALEHVELMKKYEQLLASKPAELNDKNPLFGQVDKLRADISETKASVAWASRIELRNRQRAFTDAKSIPARHNGYGVDAWPSYSEVSNTFRVLILDLNKTANISEKWSNDIDTLRKQLEQQIQAMHKGGWIVEDIGMAMSDILSIPVQGLHMEKSLRKEAEKIEIDVDDLNKEFERSIVTNIASIDKAYNDAQEYKPILKKALDAAKSGNLVTSEATLKLADHLTPSLAKTPTSRGSANYREVLMDKECFEMEEELNNLLYNLRQDAYNASLAHLAIDVTGGTFDELTIKVLDANNNDVGNWIYNSCTLESGQYRIILTSLGNRINPSEQVINLAEGEHFTIPVKIEKPVNTGTGTSVSVNTSGFNFNNIKKRVFTYNANISMEAPSWSADNKVIVIKTPDGLTAFDLQKNESWVVTNTMPFPPPGWKDATTHASFPHVMGNSVVYQMGMTGYSLADRSQEIYWMVVPIEGGQPSTVFRELSTKFRIVSVREQLGELEYMLLGEIDNQTGIFILKAGSVDYRDAELVHALNDWNVRFFVSNDWNLVCIGDPQYQNGYEIYNLAGKLTTSIPQNLFHTLAISPDNRFIAGHQRLNEAPWNQIVVVPLDDLSSINVVDADVNVVRFDEVAWSPDGRYLAYQRGIETEDIDKEVEFVVVDLLSKSKSLAVGDVITRSRDQTGLNTTTNNKKDQVKVTSTDKTNTGNDSQKTNIENSSKIKNLTPSGAVISDLNDDFSGGLGNWDISNINAEVSEGQLFWNEGNHRGVFSNFKIPLGDVIIEFDGWTASNGIALEWKDQNNNGYNISLGAYYNTSSHVGKMENGVYDWSITRGAHIQPKNWQHYKIVVESQSLKAYLDDKLIDEYISTTSLRGNGQIRFSSYNSRIGIDNVSIYKAENAKDNIQEGKVVANVITMSCADKENDENGCCCFQGAHTYSFSPVSVHSFIAGFDTGRGTNCKSTTSIQINSKDQWTTVKTVEAVSGIGGDEANYMTVDIEVNAVIQGIRISDGCTCCIDDTKVIIYTEASGPRVNDITSSTNLLTNGSFEEPVVGSYLSFSEGQEISGWKVVKESVDLTGSYFKCSEGKQSLDLYGTPGTGVIEQSFSTKPQMRYQVTFDMAGNPYAPMIKELIVSAAGKSQNFIFDCTGKSTGDMGWLPQSWEFTASNTITTLRFESLASAGSGRYGPAIDNVKVVPLSDSNIIANTISVSDHSPGKILWTHELPDEKVGIIRKSHGGDLGIRMALGLDGTIYYAAGGGRATWVDTKIYAVNKNDGSLKWRSEKLDGAEMTSHIMVGDDGTIYAVGYLTLYAFDPNTGSTKWTWQAPERLENKSTRAPLANLALLHNGDIALTALGGGAVYCLNKSGKLKWYNLDNQNAPHSLTVGPEGIIYSINELYAPDYDGSIYLIARNPDTGKKMWVHKTGRGIGGGNNIVFDKSGHLIASFIEFGASERRLHKIDPAFGNIIWSSNFMSGQDGLYLGPDGYGYQILAPPGQKAGIYRINLNNSNIELVNWSNSFGCIDNQNRLIHNFTDPEDGKHKLGAFYMDGKVAWKADIAGVDDRTFLISNDNILYGRINGNHIIAIQGDASLAQSGWPRLGGNNHNTYNSGQGKRMIK